MNGPTRRRLLSSAVALALGGLSGSAEAATGSVSLHVVSAGFIVGGGGGDGVLLFRGKQYPLSLGGLSVGATIGISGADLVGNAYNLRDPRDIEGTYTAAGAAVAVAGGGTSVQLSNARGVVLRLRGREVGFKISFALGGLTISLK